MELENLRKSRKKMKKGNTRYCNNVLNIVIDTNLRYYTVILGLTLNNRNIKIRNEVRS